MVFLVLFKIREAKIVPAKWQGTQLAKGEIISRSPQKNLNLCSHVLLQSDLSFGHKLKAAWLCGASHGLVALSEFTHCGAFSIARVQESQGLEWLPEVASPCGKCDPSLSTRL